MIKTSKVCICILLLLNSINFVSAEIFTIGSGSTCGYSQLQSAIDDAINNNDLENELRLVDDGSFNQQSFTLLQTQLKRTHIVGGFATCKDAINNSISGKTLIDAQDSQTTSPIFSIISSVAGTNSLEDFSIKFSHLILQGSKSVKGGAIYLENISTAIEDTEILNNEADLGGAIYCQSDLTIAGLLIRESNISENHASNNGGGLYIADDITPFSTSGCYTIIGADNTNTIFHNNIADNGGGAVYIGENLSDIFFGQGIFEGNRAKNGGAIYAHSGASSILAVIENNTASEKGGAVFLDNSAISSNFLHIQGEIRNNTAGMSGGAFYTNSIELHLYNSVIENNHAPVGSLATSKRNLTIDRVTILHHENSASLFEIEQTNLNDHFSSIYIGHSIIKANNNIKNLINAAKSRLTLVNSYVVDNQVNAHLVQKGMSPNGISTNIDRLDFLTIAGNTVNQSIFSFNDNIFELKNNIIWQPNNALFNMTNVNPNYKCNIVSSETEALNGIHNVTVNPQFVSAENGDYHVQISSPAIDYCEVDSFAFRVTDIDGNNGIHDIEFIPNRFGSFDIGADQKDPWEYIFVNGFE